MVFNYTKDKNNIVTLTMDMAEKSANLIDEDFFKSLLENIVKLERKNIIIKFIFMIYSIISFKVLVSTSVITTIKKIPSPK